MAFRFLEFDVSEDSDGLLTWDALASPAAAHKAEMLGEVQALLAQLRRVLGPCGPIADGHRWDMDLQILDGQGQALGLEHAAALPDRVTLALCLTGDESLGALLAADP